MKIIYRKNADWASERSGPSGPSQPSRPSGPAGPSRRLTAAAEPEPTEAKIANKTANIGSKSGPRPPT